MQHILGLVRRCVEDYHMIDPGDRIAVGVSGGTDSLLTLEALVRLRTFYPVPFTVEAITLETGTPGMDFSAVADYCAALEVPYHRVELPIYEIVFEERKEKNFLIGLVDLCRAQANGETPDYRAYLRASFAKIKELYPEDPLAQDEYIYLLSLKALTETLIPRDEAVEAADETVAPEAA